jgi:hypothetical protein
MIEVELFMLLSAKMPNVALIPIPGKKPGQPLIKDFGKDCYCNILSLFAYKGMPPSQPAAPNAHAKKPQEYIRFIYYLTEIEQQ